MKPTRRDLFTFLGLTALGAALPLKAAGRGTSEEFLIHTGQPLDTVRTILKHLNRTLSTTPVLVGLTPRAEPISRALIREGVAMAPGTDPIWQR